MTIRLFEPTDTNSVRDLIRRNLLEVNIKDYDVATMEQVANSYNDDKINSIARDAHFYVACLGDKIIGSGAVMPESKESCLLIAIFTLPEMHCCGIGKRIMEKLETDTYFAAAKQARLFASITACNFYLKLGYNYQNGCDHLNEDGLYLLTKNVQREF